MQQEGIRLFNQGEHGRGRYTSGRHVQSEILRLASKTKGGVCAVSEIDVVIEGKTLDFRPVVSVIRCVCSGRARADGYAC